MEEGLRSCKGGEGERDLRHCIGKSRRERLRTDRTLWHIGRPAKGLHPSGSSGRGWAGIGRPRREERRAGPSPLGVYKGKNVKRKKLIRSGNRQERPLMVFFSQSPKNKGTPCELERMRDGGRKTFSLLLLKEKKKREINLKQAGRITNTSKMGKRRP